MVEFLKISENHEKFVEKVDIYSSISLLGSGSGFRIRIRIQSGNLNPDPSGSGSETLVAEPDYFEAAPALAPILPVKAPKVFI